MSVFVPAVSGTRRGHPVIRQSSGATGWLYTFLNRLFLLHQRCSGLSRPDCDERLGSTRRRAFAKAHGRPDHLGTAADRKKKPESPSAPSSTLYTSYWQKEFITVINLELTAGLRVKSDLSWCRSARINRRSSSLLFKQSSGACPCPPRSCLCAPQTAG